MVDPVGLVQFSIASERGSRSGFLDLQRAALVRKLQGVSEIDARRATASSLTLLGLLKHAASWERRWVQVVFAGLRLPDEWPAKQANPGRDDFLLDDRDTVDGSPPVPLGLFHCSSGAAPGRRPAREARRSLRMSSKRDQATK